MSQASRPRYTLGYDLFKLLVFVILTIILIALLLSEQRQTSIIPTVTIPQGGTFPQGGTIPQGGTFPNPTTTIPAIPPTAIPLKESPPPTSAPTQTPTVSPTPTASPISIEPTPAFVSETCPSSQSRIQVGDEIRVLRWVYFRTGPGLYWSIRHSNKPGTELSVIGGPVSTCRDAEGGPRSYTWWNLRMRGGEEGWSAEAQLILPSYFLEAVK